jgi:Zn-dependent peptidase ImmA (M78 family)
MTTYQPAEASHLTKGAIHRLAESIGTQLGWAPGGDLKETIRRVGGSLDVEDTLLSDPEKAGSLYVDSPKSFRIIIPSHTSPERDRFTIAHEFGHFIVHYLWKKQKNPEYPDRVVAFRKGSERIEWEANWFAAAFLMPEAAYRQVFQEKSGDFWAIAEHFKVSTKAAEVRAKDLGLI